MTRHALIGLYVVVVTFGHTLLPAATPGPVSDSCRHEALALAEAYLISFKNDSAALITRELIEDLEQKGQLDTPFGLQVQLAYATALEKDQKDVEAIQKLLHVKDKSRQQRQWEVFAKSCLILANLYEKLGRQQQAWANLQQARSAIEQYDVARVYPRFAVRLSSFYRVFEINQDSSIHYAKEVLRTAPHYGLDLEEAIGHLLMGMLLSDTDYEKAVHHFSQAGRLYQKIEDYTGYSYANNGIAKLHFRHGKFRLALAYNDTMIRAAVKAVHLGHEQHPTIGRAYQFRGEIMRELGQVDSAWNYLKKGHLMELELIKKKTTEQVAEIDARYNDEQKKQQIEKQARQLRYEREKRYWVLVVVMIVSLFAFILAYYAWRLRHANQKAKAQARSISQANENLSVALEQQIMLQGEIHHRVKNNLQVIISLLELQKEDIADPKARQSLEAMSGRIYSMAAIHQVLYLQDDTTMVDLLEYTRNLCGYVSSFSLQESEPLFQLDIRQLRFNLETLMPLGIILNELLTNSLKYAAELGRRLIVNIQLQTCDDGYCLCYRDNGPGYPEGALQDREGGLGAYLLRSMSRQLNGRLESHNEAGAVCRIYFKEKNAPKSPESAPEPNIGQRPMQP